MLCVAQLLQQARALPNASAADILDLNASAVDILDRQPGEPNGPFWIVSTADSRNPNKMFVMSTGDGPAVTQIWVRNFGEVEEAKYWLYIDKEASPAKRTSAWIVSTCESKRAGEGLYLKSTVPRVSTWKHEPGRPDRKMLWDLIPADNGTRFYIVSNADSRAPNEMLFLNEFGGMSNWPFKEDKQAQWFLKRAPVPSSCYEQPGWIMIFAVCVPVFCVLAPLFCFIFGLPSSSAQLPVQGEASGNFPTTTFYNANPASLQGGGSRR